MRDYRCGSIWLVNFDPSVGVEIKKTRPAVIVSASDFNQLRKKVSLLPITSQVIKDANIAPVLVTVQSTANNGLERNSTIIAIEPNTFDKRRLVKYLGELEILDEVQQKLRIYLNL